MYRNFHRHGLFATRSERAFPLHFMGHHPGHYRRPKYNVPLNIEDKEDSYLVTVYATGFDKDKITISLSDDTLVIKGTRDIDEGAKIEFVKQEFPIKSFERSLQLNGLVNTEFISARQEDCILHITLPKSDSAKSKATEIKVD